MELAATTVRAERINAELTAHAHLLHLIMTGRHRRVICNLLMHGMSASRIVACLESAPSPRGLVNDVA